MGSGLSRIVRWLAALATVLAAACAAPPREEIREFPIISSDPFRTLAIGLCEDYPAAARSLRSAREDLETLRSSGIGYLRIALSWAEIEPDPGGFDWSFWDRFIPLATEEYHIRLLPYICYTPAWAAAPDAAGKDQNLTTRPPADWNTFASFVRAACDRYRPWVQSWELWNEPDNPAYWTGTPEEFATLVSVGSGAIRSAQPGAAVVLGGIAWDLGYLERLFKDPRVSPAVDIVNLHAYFETWSEQPAESVRAYIARAARILATRGDYQPTWLAEAGYSSARIGAEISEVYRAAYHYEHSDAFQAVYLLRLLATVAADGRVPLIAWYRVRDLPSSIGIIGDENNRSLGVLDLEGNPKPALGALHLGVELFGSPHRCIDEQIRIDRPIQSGAVVHCFQRTDGSIFALAWLRTVDPARAGVPVTMAPDPRRERVSLIFPAPVGRAALRTAVDPSIARPALSVSGRTISVVLSGGGIAIIEVEPGPRP